LLAILERSALEELSSLRRRCQHSREIDQSKSQLGGTELEDHQCNRESRRYAPSNLAFQRVATLAIDLHTIRVEHLRPGILSISHDILIPLQPR
jgi:hypothetical protein